MNLLKIVQPNNNFSSTPENTYCKNKINETTCGEYMTPYEYPRLHQRTKGQNTSSYSENNSATQYKGFAGGTL